MKLITPADMPKFEFKRKEIIGKINEAIKEGWDGSRSVIPERGFIITEMHGYKRGKLRFAMDLIHDEYSVYWDIKIAENEINFTPKK